MAVKFALLSALRPVRLAVMTAVAGAATLAVGVGLIYAPAGLIVAGLEAIGAAYLIAYYQEGR